jgi:serine/threonine-protein kinase
MWLPESYEGGDPSQDLDVIVEKLRTLGPEFAQMAKMIEQNPSAFVFWAFDSDVGDSGFLINVNVSTERVPSAITLEAYLDALVGQLPSQFRVVERGTVSLDHYQAERVLIEASIMGVEIKQVIYVIKEGNAIWAVTFSTSADEFDRRLPTFEQSMRTFKLRPATHVPTSTPMGATATATPSSAGSGIPGIDSYIQVQASGSVSPMSSALSPSRRMPARPPRPDPVTS